LGWFVLRLLEKQDDAQSAADMKLARKQFQKSYKRMWFFQMTLSVLLAIAFVIWKYVSIV
jgi:hypothetical protein